MAKIKSEYITLKLSKLIRDTETVETLFSQELIDDIESAVAALAGDGVVVEIDSITGEK